MKLLYGTGNTAKLAVMKRCLEPLDVEIIGLCDLNTDIPEVIEDGITPIKNAEKKARAYYNAFGMPVFSCDSGLYIDGIPDDIQPGVHVRRVNGKNLNDDEMIEYYSGLAKKYGDLTARYRNAICLITDGEHIYKAMEESMAGEPFIITSVPHRIKKEGFPIDSLSIDIKTGKYYYDLNPAELDHLAADRGFLEFFSKYI